MSYEARQMGNFEVYACESTIQALTQKMSEGGLSELVRQVPKRVKLLFSGWESVKGSSPQSEEIPGANAVMDDKIIISMLEQLESYVKSETEIQGKGWWCEHIYTGREEDYMESEWHGIKTAYRTIDNITLRGVWQEAMAIRDKPGYRLEHLAFGQYTNGIPVVQFAKVIFGERSGEWEYAHFEIPLGEPTTLMDNYRK